MKKNSISIVKLPDEITYLETVKMHTSSDVFAFLKNKTKQNYNPNCFLYHGIRFDENMSKLESIFKKGKILSGNKINNFSNYYDNANKGEYISLLEYSNQRVEYSVFIEPNISLLIDPLIEAYQTFYLSYNDWEKIKDLKTNNLYSYMRGEYLYKDEISFNYVKAIGFPYKYYLMNNGKEYTDEKLEKLITLMEKYNIDLPILDTSAFNKILKEKRDNNEQRHTR